MTGDSAKFQTLMNQGHSAAWDQDWDKAVELYHQALEEVPDHPSALASLGLAHFQLKQYDEALRLYQRVSALQPDDPMPFEKIARIYERTGLLSEAVQSFMQGAEMQLKARDVDRAIDDFNNALLLTPTNQTVHTRLAMIYDKLGRKDEAVAEYLATASLMQSGGDSTKAAQVVQYSLQLSPNNADAKKALVMLKNNQPLPRPDLKRESMGPVRMAQVKGLEKPEEPGPESAPTHYDPITEARLNALEEIASLLFDQTDGGDSPNQVSRRGLHVISRGTGALTPDMAEKPRIQVHLSQAIDLQTSGQDEAAAAELERAIDLGLNQSASFFVQGLLLRKKDEKKAIRYLEKAVRNPAYAMAAYLLTAEIKEQIGQFKEASVDYLQALKLADAETVPVDKSDELIQLYEPILEAHQRVTNSKDIRRLCGVITTQLMRPDWREYMTAARNQLPPQPEGSPPLPLAEMFLESNSNQMIEAMITIKHLAASGKLRSAMEEAYHALTIAPFYLPLHIQMGELLIQEGRVMEAVEKFLLVANSYTIRGETSQSINLLRRVTKLAPMDLSVRGSLIELYKASGMVDDAIQQYMDLANVYYLLAELDLARQTYQSALSLSQQSSSTRDWSVQILNKLADIELQSLDWKSAIRIFEQLRSLRPQEPGPRATLIDLHLQMGQANAAMSELESYLKIMESADKFATCSRFLDDLLDNHPVEMGIQNCMMNYYVSRDQAPKAVEKLDAIAEKLLKSEDKPATLATLKNILALNPANAADYQKLYNELSLK
jgi:tetratricopeptide (TPR) repeat protein